jgi:hypothetical protein
MTGSNISNTGLRNREVQKLGFERQIIQKEE